MTGFIEFRYVSLGPCILNEAPLANTSRYDSLRGTGDIGDAGDQDGAGVAVEADHA